MPKIKDILGAMVPELSLTVIKDRIYNQISISYDSYGEPCVLGYTTAANRVHDGVEKQGEVELEAVIDREEIAKTIWEEETLQGSLNRPSWEKARGYQKDIYYKFADAIIKANLVKIQVKK